MAVVFVVVVVKATLGAVADAVMVVLFIITGSMDVYSGFNQDAAE